MKYYKVVRWDCGEYHSAWLWSNLIYKPEEWTYPEIKGSKLFVFDNLQDAKAYVYKMSDWNFQHKIFECKVRGVEKCPVFRQPTFSYLSDFWTAIKKAKKNPKKSFNDYFNGLLSGYFPSGTYLASSVKITQEVH